MGALNRKLFRDLWRLRGQALAIALVIASGLSVFIMTLGAIASLEDTKSAYYERYRFADIFARVTRAPQRLADRIARIPGVQFVETRVVKEVVLDVPGLAEPASGRLISIPETHHPQLNDLVLREGRWVRRGHPDEVIIGEAFAEANHFGPGDSFGAIINGKKRTLKVVGIALSPEYVYTIAVGALMPDDKRYGAFWMGRDALEAAYNLDGAFNDVSVTVLRNANIRDIMDAMDVLLDPYGGTGAYDRSDQISNWYLNGEVEQLKTLASVLPVIFLSVAAFLLNMVVSRLIATERGQIGLLKAFGYSDWDVGRHYMKMVIAIAILGVLFGYVGGAIVGRWITEVYAQFFRFPFLYYRPDPAVYAAAALVSVVAAFLGTVTAVHKAIKLPPAQAMLPPPPPLYRRGLLQILGLPRLLDQPSLMILRHISRWPLRSGVTLLGTALSVAVLVVSMQWRDAIDHLMDVYFFQTQHQDVTVTLADSKSARVIDEFKHFPGVEKVEPFRAVAVRFHHLTTNRRGTILGVPPNGELSQLIDVNGNPIEIAGKGLFLSTKLADILGARRGDVLTVEVVEDRRPTLHLPVSGLFETYIGTPSYMDIDALNKAMNEARSVSGAHLAVQSDRQRALFRDLKKTPAISSVLRRQAAVDTFNKTLAETMNIMTSFYVAFACLLMFGVIYNSARISLSERGREMASLRVMGFSRGEVSYILLGELALLTFVALPLGCVMGYGLATVMSAAFDNELYRVPVAILPSTYGYSVVIAIVATVLSALVVRRRIDRLDLIAVLKTRE